MSGVLQLAFLQMAAYGVGTYPGMKARELVLTPGLPLLLRKISSKNLPFWVSVSLSENERMRLSELGSP